MCRGGSPGGMPRAGCCLCSRCTDRRGRPQFQHRERQRVLLDREQHHPDRHHHGARGPGPHADLRSVRRADQPDRAGPSPGHSDDVCRLAQDPGAPSWTRPIHGRHQSLGRGRRPAHHLPAVFRRGLQRRCLPRAGPDHQPDGHGRHLLRHGVHAQDRCAIPGSGGDCSQCGDPGRTHRQDRSAHSGRTVRGWRIVLPLRHGSAG